MNKEKDSSAETHYTDHLVLGNPGNQELFDDIKTSAKVNDNAQSVDDSEIRNDGENSHTICSSINDSPLKDGVDDLNLFGDITKESHLSPFSEIFASALAGNITAREAIHLLSFEEEKMSQNGEQLSGVLCPFTLDVVYTPKKFARLLKLMWSSGIETHLVERTSKVEFLFSSITHANRFMKICCSPNTASLARGYPEQLNWTNMVNIQKKWKFKIKTKLSKDYTTLRLVVHISLPKSDVGFILNQFNMLHNSSEN